MSLPGGHSVRETKTVMSKLAGVLANMALVLASCFTVLLLAEAGLRLIPYKYGHLARATWVTDVYQRDPGRRPMRWHPDTGEQHAYFLNNLGLRQHRDFTAAALESSVNIGFFGDSFTENISLAAEFSFTEPLDYLLNVERAPSSLSSLEGRAQPRFNVLNFAHYGWGTAQSLLRYEASGMGGTGGLDHVFYVFHQNDLNENVTHGLFRLEDRGQLERVETGRGRAFASALLSKLHLSYLTLDATKRFWGGVTQTGRLRSSALPLFRQLLRRFKEAVEAEGASFQLVWLPHLDMPDMAAVVAEEGVESVSLRTCFAEHDPAHLRTPWQRSPYRFKNNWRWNEAGNRLAAMCLHRFLERRLGLPSLSDEAVEGALRHYYSAFDAPPAPGQPADPMAAAIRARYVPLSDGEASLAQALHAPRAGQRVVRSTFDVYLQDGWLSYVKPGCDRADFDSIFFLHVVPADVGDLPPDRVAHGFDNLDFWGYPHASCTVGTRLPGYAMERIRTGQYLGDGDGLHQVLWEGEHVFVPRGADG